MLLGAVVDWRARWAARTTGGGALAAVVSVLGEPPWGREPPVRPPAGAAALSPVELAPFRLRAEHGGRGGESPPPNPAPPRAELPREAMASWSWGEASLMHAGFLTGEVAGGSGAGGCGGGE
jgi:hypothetical protein